MKVMVIDIGGTYVKVLATGQMECREFESRPKLTPRKLVMGVKKLAQDWQRDVRPIGYPGPVMRNRPVAEPHNLAKGCRAGDNANALLGGFRLWATASSPRQSPRKTAQPKALMKSSVAFVALQQEPQGSSI